MMNIISWILMLNYINLTFPIIWNKHKIIKWICKCQDVIILLMSLRDLCMKSGPQVGCDEGSLSMSSGSLSLMCCKLVLLVSFLMSDPKKVLELFVFLEMRGLFALQQDILLPIEYVFINIWTAKRSSFRQYLVDDDFGQILLMKLYIEDNKAFIWSTFWFCESST